MLHGRENCQKLFEEIIWQEEETHNMSTTKDRSTSQMKHPKLKMKRKWRKQVTGMNDGVELGGVAVPWDKKSVLPNTHPYGFTSFRCYLRQPNAGHPPSLECESHEEPREDEEEESVDRTKGKEKISPEGFYKDFDWTDLSYSLFQGEDILVSFEKDYFQCVVVSAGTAPHPPCDCPHRKFEQPLGRATLVVEKEDLPEFLLSHKDRIFVCHDVAVDFYLVKCLLQRLGKCTPPLFWRRREY